METFDQLSNCLLPLEILYNGVSTYVHGFLTAEVLPCLFAEVEL